MEPPVLPPPVAARPSFSWAKALYHWIVTWVLVGLVCGFIAAAHPNSDGNKVAELIGGFGPKSFLSVVLLSWLFQTGRRFWFWLLMAPGPVVFVGMLTMGSKSHPPMATLRSDFSRACETRCVKEQAVRALLCSRFCACLWDGLQASQPNDDAFAELFLSASKDPAAFRRINEPIALKCSESVEH